jgi:hypothetical protein
MSLLQKAATTGAFEEWDAHGKPLLARAPGPDDRTRRLSPDTALARIMTETLEFGGHHLVVVQAGHPYTLGIETRWQPTYRQADLGASWRTSSVSGHQMLLDLLTVTPEADEDPADAEAVEFLYALQGPPDVETSPSSFVRLRVAGDVRAETVWLVTSKVRNADTSLDARLAAVEPY